MKNVQIAVIFVLTLLITLVAANTSRAQTSSYELHPGVVVSIDDNSVYLMSSDGTLRSLVLANGETQWSRKGQYKPLAAMGSSLLCQMDSNNEFTLVVLDMSNEGETLMTASMTLPKPANAHIEDQLEGVFRAQTRVDGNMAYLAWNYQAKSAKGTAPELDENGAEVALAGAQGMVAFNTRSGELSELGGDEINDVSALFASSKVGSTLQPWRSIDGKHTLRSQRVKDQWVWDKFQWTVVDNTSDQAIGSIMNHISLAPFIVANDLVLFVTEEYMRRIDGELVAEPLTLRAVSLESGREVWSHALKDIRYRGPFAP